MKTYLDEYIEYWANIYLANDLYARAILFETFIADPEDILQAVMFRTPRRYVDAQPCPLLPAQRQVQDRVFDQELLAQAAEDKLDALNTRVRNGTWVEGLHHRAWPRNHNARRSAL